MTATRLGGHLVIVQMKLCHQLLDTGFFHIDPHLGNMIRTPDGDYVAELYQLPLILCYIIFGRNFYWV